jgi:multiple sugar transport system substrate-binding protein
MERVRVKNYGKITKTLFTAMFLCGLLWMVVSPGLAAEKTSLYVMSERYPTAEAMLKVASQEYTGAKLMIEQQPRKTKADKLRVLFHGRSPDLDLLLVNQDEIPEYAPFLEPLDGYIKKYWDEYKFGDIEPASFELMRYEGKTYGVPNDTNTNLLFYRKDLFDAAGLSMPKTTDEWLHAAKKLTTNGRKGIAIQLKRPVSTIIGWGYYLWSAGGDFLDKDMNPVFNNKQGVQALELLGKFYQYAPKDCLNYWGDELTNSLNQDMSASALNWISRCKKMDDPSVSKVIGKIEFGPPPGIFPAKGCAFNATGGYAISKFSRHKEEAFKLLSLLCSQEYGYRFASMSLAPRASVMTNPELVAKYRWLPAALETLKHGRVLPNFPEWWEVADYIAIQVHRYLMGQVSAKAGLDLAAEQARAALKEKGYIK